MDLALLIIAAKVFLNWDQKKDKDDPCAFMIEGSPAHIQCLIENR